MYGHSQKCKWKIPKKKKFLRGGVQKIQMCQSEGPNI